MRKVTRTLSVIITEALYWDGVREESDIVNVVTDSSVKLTERYLKKIGVLRDGDRLLKLTPLMSEERLYKMDEETFKEMAQFQVLTRTEFKEREE